MRADPVRGEVSLRRKTWSTVKRRGDTGGVNAYCNVQIAAVGETSLTLYTSFISGMYLELQGIKLGRGYVYLGDRPFLVDSLVLTQLFPEVVERCILR